MLSFFFSVLCSLLWAADLPPAPQQYVVDEPHVLSVQTLRVLNQKLQEQDQKTGQQIIFAIFNSALGEDPAQRTNAIFKAWALGQKGKDNGALLALYWKEHRARIEVGYGLEAVLTDAKSKKILATILAPQLKAGQADQGLLLTAEALLAILVNPETVLAKAPAPPPLHFSWVWVVLALLLVTILYRVFVPSREQRFRRAQQAKLRSPGGFPLFFPWPERKRGPRDPDDFFGGGGWGGGGSSGGGFGGGGGGASGGGGAGADW